MKTSCELCCFANFDEANVQTGCKLGRLERFKEMGVEVTLRQADNGRTAALIGRVCVAARKDEWGVGLSDEEKIAKVQKELTVSCHVYVPALEETPEQIEETLFSLVGQNPKPVAVEVVVHGRYRPGKLIRRLQEKFDDKLNWRLTVVNADYTTTEEAIDKSAPACKGVFYSIVRAGTQMPPTFMENLNRVVKEELLAFAVITGDVPVFLRKYHELLGGNATVDMVEGDPETMSEEELAAAPTTPVTGLLNKLRFLTETVGIPNLIVEGESLCPTLK